jgi:hypothetical protein
MGIAGATVLGSLFQPVGCIGFASDQVQRSVNFCFLFDCQNGALGGLIDFCPNNVNQDGTVPSGNANTFADCIGVTNQ